MTTIVRPKTKTKMSTTATMPIRTLKAIDPARNRIRNKYIKTDSSFEIIVFP